MKKSILFVLGLVLLSLVMLNFVDAKISISEPLDIYSFGDKLYVSVDVVPSSLSGNFEIDLICNEEEINIYRIPAESSFVLSEEQTISTYLTLSKNYGNISGSCRLEASLGGDITNSKTFQISDIILVNARFDKQSYDPAQTITLLVDAVKSNGHLLNGFMEVSGAVDFSKAVEGGVGKEQFAMPDTIEAGEYKLDILVYDRGNNNEVYNRGNTSIIFNINQIPTYIQTSLSDLEVIPGDEFSVGAELFDQSGITMGGTIYVNVVSPKGISEDFSLNSGEIINIDFPYNATPGTWNIYSFSEEINDVREFEVLPIQKAEFDFLDSILIVRNIGNAVYNKTIEINIGEDVKELVLNIQPGEERRFNLKAPNGEYEVLVSDGDSNVQRNLLLTGNAISISDLKGIGVLSKYPIIWLFIIFILVAVAVVVFFKFRHKEFRLKDKIKAMNFLKKKDNMVDTSEDKGKGNAEQSLVLKGDKENASIICLKINGLKQLGSNAKEKLKAVLKIAKDNRGMINVKDDYILIIFTPLVTKTFKNEISATKTGEKLRKELSEYNKKSVEKIDFGLGVNSGILINSIENGKLKYTSVGSSVLISKRLADVSKGKLLVSDSIKNKLARDIQVEKIGNLGDKPYYGVQKVSDREANQDRLRVILDRMKKEDKK